MLKKFYDSSAFREVEACSEINHSATNNCRTNSMHVEYTCGICGERWWLWGEGKGRLLRIL